jgi:hypothetical protein
MAAYYNDYDDNILIGATISANATPMTGYALTTLASIYPDARVRFSTTTVTITFTIASTIGAILMIPWHNFTPGSGSVLTLTNGAGLSQAITIPALMANGLPHPIVYDFSALANRTSTTWNLVISGNATNVQVGAGISIYSAVKSFSSLASGNIEVDFTLKELHHQDEETNEYGTTYIQDYGTHQRTLEFSVVGSASQISSIVDLFRANHGRSRPSLLWPDTTTTVGIIAPIYGRFQKELSITSIPNGWYRLRGVFQEMSRGRIAS